MKKYDIAADSLAGRLYLWVYRRLLPKRYGQYLARAGGDRDMCHEALLHGTFYEEYRLYDFANKGEAERRTYLTDAVRNRICLKVNSVEGERVVMNKRLTYQALSEFYHRRLLPLDTPHLDEAVAMGLSDGALVLKPVGSCGGRGVMLLEGHSREVWLKQLEPYVNPAPQYIVEQRIIQSPDMGCFNTSTVNTIRINTIQRNGRVVHFTAFVLMGRAGSFVNNGAQGGLFAAIDTATGQVITDAFDEKGLRYAAHPDSGEPLRGRFIPQWTELLGITESMARRIKGCTFVAWDMSLTPQGWVLVEANRGEFVAQQITLGRGLRRDFESLTGYSASGSRKARK